MNILHHKSWHVRNKNNIARVRRDEAKAKEEEEAKDKRRLIAESEARINLLRSNSTRNETPVDQIAAIFTETEPSSANDDRKNEDHAKEVKKEKEEWEKKVGILTFLGQGCNEVDKPWYLQSHTKRMFPDSKDDSSSTSSNQANFHHIADPLVDMQRYLDIMKKSKPNPEIPTASVKSSKHAGLPAVTKEIERDISVPINKKKVKKSKKSKKSKKRKHGKLKSRHKRSKKSSSEEDSSSSDESVDQEEKRAKLESLRAERLRRERAERERVDRLLNKQIKPEPVIEADRDRRYNSQYNPHLAKQNMDVNR